MRELTREERQILENHKKWLRGEGGERANLRRADLSNANLREVRICKGRIGLL